MKLKHPTYTLPKKLYHVSNPIYRKQIKKEGLTPQIGDSYRLHWESEYPTQEIKPCVFLSTNNKYDSTYDDDRYEVLSEFVDVDKLYIDPSYNGECLMYFDTIPTKALKIIHKGTGDSID